MRILLINPPHPSISSRIPREHLPPLGLLSVGGPLIDAGHDVRLLDAEFGPMSTKQIVEQAVGFASEAILVSHSGSTSGHRIVAAMARAMRAARPTIWIGYGGYSPRITDFSMPDCRMVPAQCQGAVEPTHVPW